MSWWSQFRWSYHDDMHFPGSAADDLIHCSLTHFAIFVSLICVFIFILHIDLLSIPLVCLPFKSLSQFASVWKCLIWDPYSPEYYTTFKRLWDRKKENAIIRQERIKAIKSDSKDIYNHTKYFHVK